MKTTIISLSECGNHPCPFCNCDEVYVSKRGEITCANCQARGPIDNRAFEGTEIEVEMWNTRMAHREELRERDAKISEIERKLKKAEQTIDALNQRIVEEIL